jgi:hypothetical protein
MLASTHLSRLAAVAPAKASRAARVVLRAVEVQKAPLLNRLGGPEAIKAAVDVFYGKVGCQHNSSSSTAARRSDALTGSVFTHPSR